MSNSAVQIPGLPTGWPFPTGPSIGLLLPSAGPTSGGNTVLILGSGLNNASSVTFGGTPATILFGDPIGFTLLVLAPAHAAGTVPVIVTTPSGTSAPAMYTYLAATPPPIVFTFSPTSGPTTGGTAFTITGLNLTGASVTFNGVPATSVVVNGTGTILTGVTPAGAAGNATVVVTTAGGSVTVAGGFTYVSPLPPTAVSITPTSGPIAGHTPFVIFGTNLTGASVDFGGSAATNVVVDSSGTILAGLTPPHTAGNVVVTVTTPGGSATVPGGYTYA